MSTVEYRPAWLADLHNHTCRSYDASNCDSDYLRAYEDGLLNVLAITDHNTIDGALECKERLESSTGRGLQVIVGEEVDTAEGELIGLFLTEALPVGHSAAETAHEIRRQGGLVYLQHPYCRYVRTRLEQGAIEKLLAEQLVDIVETDNGGPLMGRANRLARDLAARHGLPRGAGSDAHHPGDIGRCVVEIEPGFADAQTFLASLARGRIIDKRRSTVAGLYARLGYAVGVSVARVGGAPKQTRRP
jgi:predicted metal-dependent phosphoesterase TrpH